MAVTINLSALSSNMVAYFGLWDTFYNTPNFGAFWNDTDGVVTQPDPTATYTQYGAGDSANFLNPGIVLDGTMQYAQGNLTGTVDTITLGYFYNESNASGMNVFGTMEILNDTSYDLSGARDLFDFAIFELTTQGSLSGFYTYFGAVGAIIDDTSGNDVMVGFAGADTFVFSGGDDQVTSGDTGTFGFQDGTDLLNVSAWGVTDYASLSISSSGADTLIEFGSDSITLVGVDASAIDASDFLLAA